MEIHFISLRKNAAVYIVKILIGSLIAWFGMQALGIAEPYWALVSVISVTEPDVTQARANFKARLINTLSGSAIACVVLVTIGANFASMMLALTLAVLVAMLWEHYPSNWRLGPVTVVILMSAAIAGNSRSQELHLALLRVGEVLAGSAIALVQSLVYAKALSRWAQSE